MNRTLCKCGAWVGIGCICLHCLSVVGHHAEFSEHLSLGEQRAIEVHNYHSTEVHYVDRPIWGSRVEWVIPGVRSTGTG